MSLSNKLSNLCDDVLFNKEKKELDGDHNLKYLSTMSPNIIQWVTGIDYWNVPTTFEFFRQYQILRDLFNCRCKICNSQDPGAIDPWGKSRNYLESEILFEWSEEHHDFQCPKCRSVHAEHIRDGLISPYDELICIAGMRSGKSYTGAHIAGYLEHILRVISMEGPHAVPKYFHLEKSEWLDCTFAASTTTQAEHTVFAKFRHMRDNSPWINKHVSYVKYLENKQVSSVKDSWSYKSRVDAVEDGWLQVRFNRIASDASGAAGRTRVYGCIDEWARLVDTDGTRSSKELYAVINQSLKTVRAAINHNPLFRHFGIMANVTSAWAHDDPAYELYNKAAAGELKKTYFWKGATWEFNPKITKEDLADDFIKDRAQAERDFASNPPLSSSVLIENPELFWRCIDFGRKPVVNFSETTVHDPTGKMYKGMMVRNCDLDTSGTGYFIVVDAGLNWDCFAFVIGHGEWRSLEDFKVNEGLLSPDDLGLEPVRQNLGEFQRDQSNRNPDAESRGLVPADVSGFRHISESSDFVHASKVGGFLPVDEATIPRYQSDDRVFCTVVDGMFRIIPTDTHEIWYNSILDIISQIHNNLNIVSIRADHWNSANLFQNIRLKYGIHSDYYRVKPEDFLSFPPLTYQGRVSLLPPSEADGLKMDESGNLIQRVHQEYMAATSVGIVELLKLNKSPDGRRFYNERKGSVRGRDSDDLARCIITLNSIIQNSVVSSPNKKRVALLEKQKEALSRVGGVYKM